MPPPPHGHPPQLQPRNPKVSVPMISPNVVKSPDGDLTAFCGVKARFVASSPNRVSQSEVSPRFGGMNGAVNGNGSPQSNDLRRSVTRHSGVSTPKRSLKQHQQAVASRGQTPDWIRDIFVYAKRGNSEKLVSQFGSSFILLCNWTNYHSTFCWKRWLRSL